MLLAFGLIASVVLFMENAVEQWGAIHLEQDLHTSALLSSIAPATYMLGLFAGRLLAQWRGDRVSPRTLVLLSGALGASAIALAGATPLLGLPPILALLSFGAAGLGLAPAVPTVMSVAGHSASDPGRPDAIATVTTVSYLGFLLSPPVVGALAGEYGLSTALCVTATGGLLVAGASRLVSTPQQPQRANVAGVQQ